MFGVYANDGRLVASYSSEDVAKTAAPTYGCDPEKVKAVSVVEDLDDNTPTVGHVEAANPSPPAGDDTTTAEKLAVLAGRIDNLQQQVSTLEGLAEVQAAEIDRLTALVDADDDDAVDLDGTVGGDTDPTEAETKPEGQPTE